MLKVRVACISMQYEYFVPFHQQLWVCRQAKAPCCALHACVLASLQGAPILLDSKELQFQDM